MLRAGFEHVHLVVLQDDLGLNDLQALRTEAIGEVVVNIRPVVPGGIHLLCARLLECGTCFLFDRFATSHVLLPFEISLAWDTNDNKASNTTYNRSGQERGQ